MSEHTPTPYKYIPAKSGQPDGIDDAVGNPVVNNIGWADGPFIVRAVNAHATLMKALTDARGAIASLEYAAALDIGAIRNELLTNIDAALALAKAGA